MSYKKWLMMFSILLVVASTALVGCSNETKSSAEKTEVVLAGWGGNPEEMRLLKQTIAEFEKKHPEISVKHEVITDQYMDIL